MLQKSSWHSSNPIQRQFIRYRVLRSIREVIGSLADRLRSGRYMHVPLHSKLNFVISCDETWHWIGLALTKGKIENTGHSCFTKCSSNARLSLCCQILIARHKIRLNKVFATQCCILVWLPCQPFHGCDPFLKEAGVLWKRVRWNCGCSGLVGVTIRPVALCHIDRKLHKYLCCTKYLGKGKWRFCLFTFDAKLLPDMAFLETNW